MDWTNQRRRDIDMSNSLIERTDHEIRDDVERELDKAEGVDSTLIGVAVHDGVVSLTGEVSNHWQRAAATHIALQTRGVNSVANDIVVSTISTATDARIAESSRDAIRGIGSIPNDAVLVEVRDHVVTLTGSVDTPELRSDVHRVVQALPAVASVINNIGVQTRPSSVHTQILIKSALIQNAVAEADNLDVRVEGTTVLLSGSVASEAGKAAVVEAARKSAHVSDVVDDLEVQT